MQWYLLETEKEYKNAKRRFQEISDFPKDSIEHREAHLLTTLICEFEKKKYLSSKLDPIALINLRIRDLGYTTDYLVTAYGNKKAVSKVLSYRQTLSLDMIRKFSNILQIPAAALIKEYELQ